MINLIRHFNKSLKIILQNLLRQEKKTLKFIGENFEEKILQKKTCFQCCLDELKMMMKKIIELRQTLLIGQRKNLMRNRKFTCSFKKLNSYKFVVNTNL